MKKDSEKKIEPALVKVIETHKGLCIKLVTLHFTGLPDRLCLLPGARIIFCETKSTKETLSERQKLVHKDLRALGFDVRVIDTLIDIKFLDLELRTSHISKLRH